MEIAQGYARRPKRIYAVENCGFFPFCGYCGLSILHEFSTNIHYEKSAPQQL